MANQTLLNMDCMEYMAGLPDKAFDLAIVDPPYGLGSRLVNGGMQKIKGRMSASQYVGKTWDTPPDKTYFDELFRISINQIVWGGNYFSCLGASRGFIVWDKCQAMPTMSFGEFAWTSFDCPAKQIRYAYTNYVEGKGPPSNKIHPTQKPVALYEWLLTNYAKPGQRILDTHLGSGSSAIAAYNLGFEFVGTELDADYYSAAVKRFESHKAQALLFQPDDYDRVELDYQEKLL